MIRNKSFFYVLPLIEGWSAKAGCPNNCYAKCIMMGMIIANYDNKALPHGKGIIVSDDGKSVNISHNIMSEYIEDYELIMNGKYSRISEEAKQLILERTESMMDYDYVESVLYKSKKLRKYLENKLDLPNLEELIDEYESVFGKEEIFKLK